MNTLERFERRKKILNECRNNQSSVVVNIDLDKISNEADTERISKIHADLDNFYSFEPDMSVSDQEVNNLLEK
ncbi:MAG: hypothetical protein WCR55_14505 [Lentisphaerota bacterium]